MTPHYTLFRRGKIFYAQDSETCQQTSLRTKDKGEAEILLHAKNEAFRQPVLNLQIARTYLSAPDPEISKRTWSAVMNEVAKTKTGVTLHRHNSAMKDAAFDLIREMPILETQAVHFIRVLEAGCVSTNIFLRRPHNFALGMNWLPWPILPKKRWPKISFKEKRAVMGEEHRAIVEGEHNPERRAYYECCWHLGASQTDVASLTAEDIDWKDRVVNYLYLGVAVRWTYTHVASQSRCAHWLFSAGRSVHGARNAAREPQRPRSPEGYHRGPSMTWRVMDVISIAVGLLTAGSKPRSKWRAQ